MALSDEKIAEIGEACGLGCKIADADYPCDMLWFDGNPTQFARAIEAEVRKQDDELIRQMDAALDASEAFLLSAGFESSDAFQEVSAALTAGRARLEGKA